MKAYFPKFAALLMATVFSTPFTAMAVPILADGSFETPALANNSFASSYAYAPTGTAWTFNSNSGISANGGPFYSGSAPSGVQAAFLQSLSSGAGSISQVITGLVPGASYIITFSLASRDGYAANTVDVKFGSADLGQYTNTALQFVTETTAAYTATDTSALLAFYGMSVTGSDYDAALDAISITQVTTNAVTAVPEPASVALLCLGTAAVVATRRRKIT